MRGAVHQDGGGAVGTDWALQQTHRAAATGGNLGCDTFKKQQKSF